MNRCKDKIECSKCKIKITKQNYNKHYSACKGCGLIREQYKSLPKHKKIAWNKGKSSWKKNLTKETDERVKKHAELVSKTLKGRKNKPCSKETIEKLSLIRIKNRTKYTHWKHVKYVQYIKKDGNIIQLRGSYEVRYATWLDKNSIDWEYEKPIQYIDKKGIKRHCLPDFYLPDLNEYHDTKGYLSEESKEKYSLIKDQLGIEIKLIFKKDLDQLPL